MADTAIAVTPGAGTNIDVRTEATNGDARQVVVVGDPSVNAGVAPVDGTLGLAVQHVSGSILSGAVASGAFASGSIAAGAISAGAIATGATSIAANEDDASASADTGVKMLVTRQDTPAATSNANGDYEFLQVSGGMLWVRSKVQPFTVSVGVTRPADTTAYAIDDAMANATAAAAVQTYSNVARVTGGSLLITDVFITSSNNAPATMLQGELWLLDTAPAANNDNAAFTLSDSEILTVVAVIPFTLAKSSANNCHFHAIRQNILCTTVGSANLTGQLKVKNAYTPASGEVLTVRLKGLWLD